MKKGNKVIISSNFIYYIIFIIDDALKYLS